MIRFDAGQPVGMYLSSHDSGEGYAWNAMQKSGDRPVHYVAHGSHANYATPGCAATRLIGVECALLTDA